MEKWDFLPISKEDMIDRGWYWYDFLVVTGDAYVDHPSFGTAVIARLLEKEGFRVAVLAQPDWHDCSAFTKMGKPRHAVMIGAGNLDSMVAKYTAAKKPRSEDFYSPGKKAGLRPDRATIVYSNRAREAFGDTPIIVGSLEASLRRFAHYDYWDDKVRHSVLSDSGADMLVYGMGESATREIARRLKKKEAISNMRDIRGTAFFAASMGDCAFPDFIELPSYEQVCAERRFYADATRVEYEEHDPISGHALIQAEDDRFLVVNPPAMPLGTEELDAVAALPFTREVHPVYDDVGGVPAIDEVRFSTIHNRGCFGACNFCALSFHQGRIVTSRSHDSVCAEVEKMTHHPLWKGYVNDVGGPTANFRKPACKNQMKVGMCRGKKCLAPEPCKNLDADHSDYLRLLRRLRSVPGVKRVFIRSGIRFDYMLCDESGDFFSELVRYHVSGQLKVAPEHCIDSVLDYMGKPHVETYEKFSERYKHLNQRYDKEQYVVPYLMSSHPGSTLSDAIALAEYLNSTGRQPQQVQDFYPTPGTISTCMYYTEIDPFTMKPVYVPKTPHEKAMQRSLLQWRRPENRRLIMQALREANREDLIGFDKRCLLRPERSYRPDRASGKTDKASGKAAKPSQKAPEKPQEKMPEKPQKRGKGWAKAKVKAPTRPPRGKGKK